MSKPKKSNLINVAWYFFLFLDIKMLILANIMKFYVHLRWNKPTFNLIYNIGIG